VIYFASTKTPRGNKEGRKLMIGDQLIILETNGQFLSRLFSCNLIIPVILLFLYIYSTYRRITIFSNCLIPYRRTRIVVSVSPYRCFVVMRYQFVCYAMLSASKHVSFSFAIMEVRLAVEVLTTLFFVVVSSIQYDVSREVWMMTMQQQIFF
jgi:hypothetical protein